MTPEPSWSEEDKDKIDSVIFSGEIATIIGGEVAPAMNPPKRYPTMEAQVKTEYQFLTFRQIPFAGKTSKWSCVAKSDIELGEVRWYGAWRQYCYLANIPAVYSAGCLSDIQDFIKQLKSR